MFMKLQSLHVVRHLVCCVAYPLGQQIATISPLQDTQHTLSPPSPKESFKNSIQEKYLAVRSDSQYVSFPQNANIIACQVSNGQFCHINYPLYVANTSKLCSHAFFLKDKVKNK